jgi:streptogramin lyase
VFAALAVLGAAVLIVAILAIAGVFSSDDEGDVPPTENFGEITTAATTTTPAPTAQPMVKRIPVGGRPDAISAGAGLVWVTDSFAGTLKKINPRNDTPHGIPAAGFPTDVSAGEGAAWVALPDRGEVEWVGTTGPIHLQEVRGFPFQIAASEGAVWAMAQKTVERLDPATGRPDGQPTQLHGAGSDIAAGEGWIWVTRSNRAVVRISPDDGELSDSEAGVPGAFNVAVGESAVWALGAQGTLTRIDPESGEAEGSPLRVPQALDVAAGLGSVWVTAGDGAVRRFDPESGEQVGKPIEVGRQPQSIAVGEGAVWVACAGNGSVHRIAR